MWKCVYECLYIWGNLCVETNDQQVSIFRIYPNCFCLLACFFLLFWYRISQSYMWLANLARPLSPMNLFPHFWRLLDMDNYAWLFTDIYKEHFIHWNISLPAKEGPLSNAQSGFGIWYTFTTLSQKVQNHWLYTQICK